MDFWQWFSCVITFTRTFSVVTNTQTLCFGSISFLPQVILLIPWNNWWCVCYISVSCFLRLMVSPEKGSRCFLHIVFILSVYNNGRSPCECCWCYSRATSFVKLSIVYKTWNFHSDLQRRLPRTHFIFKLYVSIITVSASFCIAAIMV
jgi:hypothetical protein